MKKYFALILAALMLLGLFAGCTGGSGENAATPAANNGSTAANSGSTNSGADAPENNIGYPIVTDGSITLTLCMSMPQEAAPRLSSFLDDGINLVWPELVKRTGINLEMITFLDSSYDENVNILIAGGDLPDILRANYPGGVQKAYEDEIVIRLNEYEDLMPNYMYWVNQTEANRKAAYTDAGNLIGMSQVYDRTESGWAGYFVRQDWLEDLGMEKPTTIGEWTAMLEAFKQNKTGGRAPMDYSGSGMNFSNFFHGAYGVANGSIIKQDGKIVYSYTTPGMLEYLKQINAWYNAGYISPDYVSNGPFVIYPDTAKIGDNTFGAIHAIDNVGGTYYADSGIAEPGAYFGMMPWPTVNKGDDLKVKFKGDDSANLGSNGWLISTDCEYPEYAVRFLDYPYGEEGMILTNYGIEGISFNYDANGQPQFTDLIKNNPDMNNTAAQQVYLINNNFILSVTRNEAAMSEECLKYNEYWGETGEWNFSAAVSYTSEESARRSAIQNDLDTYNSEMINKFITGVEPLTEENFQKYVDKLNSMGLEEFVQITQTAYDRWLVK